jgi:hypothetical protein
MTPCSLIGFRKPLRNRIKGSFFSKERAMLDFITLSGCAKVLDYLNTWPCGLVKADLYVGQ